MSLANPFNADAFKEHFNSLTFTKSEESIGTFGIVNADIGKILFLKDNTFYNVYIAFVVQIDTLNEPVFGDLHGFRSDTDTENYGFLDTVVVNGVVLKNIYVSIATYNNASTLVFFKWALGGAPSTSQWPANTVFDPTTSYAITFIDPKTGGGGAAGGGAAGTGGGGGGDPPANSFPIWIIILIIGIIISIILIIVIVVVVVMKKPNKSNSNNDFIQDDA